MSVRKLVVDKTRAVHEALHVHPLIGRLTEPSLSIAEYTSILRGFSSVYLSAEARRAKMGVWPQFALAKQCRALTADCGAEWRCPRLTFAEIRSSAQMLGMLYALHGAQFGASVIRRNLCVCIPNAPHRFFSIGTHPDTWRDLVGSMEELYLDREDLALGAQVAFAAIRGTCLMTASDENA